MQVKLSANPASSSAAAARRSRVRAVIVGSIGALVLTLLAGFGFMYWRMNYIPADLDVSTTRASAQQLFSATILPAATPIPINKLQRWTLHLETPDGQPVNGATIAVDGDMPQHGHGLPTQPQVTQQLGNGDYLVEGMKFQMGGWWVVDFTIDAAGKHDTVRFNLILQ
jgi:hypothetical protein